MFPVRIYGNAQCFSCALLLSGYSILTPAGVNMSESRSFHLLSRHLFAALGSSCVSVFYGSQRSHALCLTLWLVLINIFSSSLQIFKKFLRLLMTCKAQAGRSVALGEEDNPICEVFFCISIEQN